MVEIAILDKALMDQIQQDLPLVSNPFGVIGSKCGLSEAETLRRVRDLISAGLIREISAILNAEGIGYKSTLAALQVRSDLIECIAARINAHPGVSHNYLRDHKYNMWFTLTIRHGEDFQESIERLVDGAEVSCLILPAIRTFKIRVNFRLSQESENRSTEKRLNSTSRKSKERHREISPFDRKLLAILQDGFEIVSNPWDSIAGRLDISTKELFTKINSLKEAGAIKRISGVLRHGRIGFNANGMACFALDDDRIEEAGRRVAEFPEVSHCYQRKICPEWCYPLFAMVHGKDRGETNAVIENIRRSIDCSDSLVLYSLKELKKERVKYFREQP